MVIFINFYNIIIMGFIMNSSLLKNIILYLGYKVRGLGRTQLMKLVYLIDREYYLENGRTLTGSKWFLYYYGPYSEEVVNAYNQLIREGKLREEQGDIGYHIYPLAEPELDNSIKDLINKIIEELGYSKDSAWRIKKYVYELPEVQATEWNDEIDFSKAKNTVAA